ncbi:hypothetical protein [Streptomyces sp. NPDC002324]
MVVGPENLPVITDAMIRALQETDERAADYFVEFLEINLRGTPAGDKWREIMSFVTYFPGRGTVRETAYLEGKAEGKAEGEARGEAKGVLRVLEVRGIPVSDDVRARITTCTDLTLVSAWLDRAGTVERAEDLFTDRTAETSG